MVDINKIYKDIYFFLKEAYALEYSSMFIEIDGKLNEVFFTSCKVDEMSDMELYQLEMMLKKELPELKIQKDENVILFLWNRSLGENVPKWMGYYLECQKMYIEKENVQNGYINRNYRCD